MHIFHIKGFSGLLLFGLAMVCTALLVFVLPSAFMMVLWNATVFEGFSGPQINLSQGFVLWLAAIVLFKLVFKPEIQFQFKSVSGPDDIERFTRDFKNKPDDKKQ
jgi:hypothetical protein